jgi:hypothetical protein
MQLYSADVIYASTNTTGSIVTDGFGNTNLMTAQMELSNANAQIFQIAELPLNAQAAGNSLQLSWPAFASTYQLQYNFDLSKTNGWKPDAHTPTLSGGYYRVTLTPPSATAFYRIASP